MASLVVKFQQRTKCLRILAELIDQETIREIFRLFSEFSNPKSFVMFSSKSTSNNAQFRQIRKSQSFLANRIQISSFK